MRSKRFAVLLVVVAIVGVIVSLAAWCFLEAIHQITQELYTHLPHALGYDNGAPTWWPLPILAIGALIVALAITRLPGNGGHIPADGLAVGGPSRPENLPGILLAGLGTISSGLVLGPEGPLIALGGGLAALLMSLSRRQTPPQALMVVAAAGSFSALSFIFSSPLIAAVILIEASGIGGPMMRVLLVPGLLAAGIGTLVSIGVGSFTGLSTSAYALGTLSLSAAPRPTAAAFGWTIALAIAIALATSQLMRGGKLTHRFVVSRRILVLLPAIALIVGGLAIAFAQITGHGSHEVLFSGQDQLPGLVSQAGTWSLGALAWLIVFKGLAYSLSLGSYRGGPTFPALFLGAAAGIMCSHLPGFPIQAGVAVGMGAAVVAVLRLPLSAVVIATLLTVHASDRVEPLIIVGVVVAYVITLLVSKPSAPSPEPVRA
ncbi:MAG TPA: chloride channel protein [Solirubrobacteraceae bacterium]|nr:chloride channel protein [Solirubrobacteraceae bacterium]